MPAAPFAFAVLSAIKLLLPVSRMPLFALLLAVFPEIVQLPLQSMPSPVFFWACTV